MFTARNYLRYELGRIEQVLTETLRYRYATFEFFEECMARLDEFKRTVEEAAESDLGNFHDIAWNLEWFSALISKIERSHAEEFAWPFAQALKRVMKTASAMLFFFGADGGMSGYSIQPDDDESVYDKKIVAVEFPRALKNSVLVHAVLGHEMGHAIIHEQQIDFGPARQRLAQGSVVAGPKTLFEWCKANLGVKNDGGDAYHMQQGDSWVDEFFCDVFGLICMGPAYLHAVTSLLEVRSARNADDYVSQHPPFASRLVVLLHAARALKLLHSESDGNSWPRDLSAFFDESFVRHASRHANGPFDILDAKMVAEIAIEIRELASRFPDLVCPLPIAELPAMAECLRNDTPPSGPSPLVVEENGKFAISEVKQIDFRTIIYAGWIAALDDIGNVGRFEKINRLCSFAIMQQEGVAYWNGDAVALERGLS